MFRRLRLSRATRGAAEILPPPERSIELVDADEYAAPINRSAVIVRVKQPFIDWANSLDDGPSAKLRTYEPTLMLVDEMEDPAEWPHVEKGLWGRIFEYQLAGCTGPPSSYSALAISKSLQMQPL